MKSKLSDLLDNLPEIFNKECEKCMKIKKFKSGYDLIWFKNNRSIYRCKEYRKPCYTLMNEAVKNFPNTYQFCKGDLNKFVLLLKEVYLYEYMDSWEKFDETSLSNKKVF